MKGKIAKKHGFAHIVVRDEQTVVGSCAGIEFAQTGHIHPGPVRWACPLDECRYDIIDHTGHCPSAPPCDWPDSETTLLPSAPVI